MAAPAKWLTETSFPLLQTTRNSRSTLPSRRKSHDSESRLENILAPEANRRIADTSVANMAPRHIEPLWDPPACEAVAYDLAKGGPGRPPAPPVLASLLVPGSVLHETSWVQACHVAA
jgi:hypothetical protein